MGYRMHSIWGEASRNDGRRGVTRSLGRGRWATGSAASGQGGASSTLVWTRPELFPEPALVTLTSPPSGEVASELSRGGREKDRAQLHNQLLGQISVEAALRL